MKIVILGATRGMGRALAQQAAARGDELFLLGNEVDELPVSAADAQARHSGSGVSVGHAACDLERTDSFGPALDAATAHLGKIDAVIVTAALFATQDRLEADPEFARRLLTVNFANTVVFCEEVRKRLLAAGGGTLVVFSSVAGDRGRKPIAIYGASKAGLSHYLESIDHKFHEQGLRVVTIKPGFIKTGMTAGLKPPPFAGEPEKVAASVLRAMDKGTPVLYTPAPWRLVMFIIKRLPRFVMRKIKF